MDPSLYDSRKFTKFTPMPKFTKFTQIHLRNVA